MAQRKKILIFESKGLLIASILSLLAERADYEVFSGAFTAPDPLLQFNGYTPDVLIIEKSQLMENVSKVQELFERFPRLRLFVLGLDDNKLIIFEKQIVHVEQFSDFLEIL
ncbi:MAG: hypothetical protein ACK2T4_10155 [Candidatus Promineifilaceae bacterium]|jgi:DNA-binding NarL/FixJ family response regulator